MLLQPEPHLLWQANYKSMVPAQLVDELGKIAKNPHHYPDRAVRRAFITHELVLRGVNRDCKPTTPIILAE